MEIGNAPYLASLRMDQAKSWEEFRAACAYSRIPAENMVWGDVDKNIGYQAVGISPIRPNWSGLVPVPGDGRYEWDGFLPIEALPHVENPPRGYWATANNLMVPDDYPYPTALHWEWGDEMRGLRENELLATGRRFTIVDMMQFQHDELSIPARNIVPLLRHLELSDARSRDALGKLLNWDFVLDKESIAAAIYVSFERRLLDNIAARLVPEKARELVGRLNKKRVIDWLVAPDGRFGDQPLAGRDEILRTSLDEAVANLTKRLGADMSLWQYGQSRSSTSSSITCSVPPFPPRHGKSSTSDLPLAAGTIRRSTRRERETIRLRAPPSGSFWTRPIGTTPSPPTPRANREIPTTRTTATSSPSGSIINIFRYFFRGRRSRR